MTVTHPLAALSHIVHVSINASHAIQPCDGNFVLAAAVPCSSAVQQCRAAVPCSSAVQQCRAAVHPQVL